MAFEDAKNDMLISGNREENDGIKKGSGPYSELGNLEENDIQLFWNETIGIEKKKFRLMNPKAHKTEESSPQLVEKIKNEVIERVEADEKRKSQQREASDQNLYM